MPLTCFRTRPVVFALITGLSAIASSVAAAGDKTFNKPTFQNSQFGVINLVRLDWCWQHQQMCGKRAADFFCKSRGFQSAASFEKDPAIGFTVSMGDKKVCNKGVCDGFASITCQAS